MAKVGVVLSGCGYLDGSEIHESVLTLLALSRRNAEVLCMAPDNDQAEVVNHLTGEKTHEKRNILVEAARIARGKIKNIRDVRASDIDALVFPGGFGAAKNLCDFASKGPDCSVHPEVARLARDVHAAGKPIGAICISPALISKIFEGKSIKVTIGKDADTAKAVEKMGQKHQNCEMTEMIVDTQHKIVTTPAYMFPAHIASAAEGIDKLVGEVLRMAQKPAAVR